MSEGTSYYIQGIGNISPQHTFDNTTFLNDITAYQNNILTCITPDFKQYINPVQLRRMSRMFKIGLTAAQICTRDAGLEMPDAIITASGYGCAGDTSRFLHEITENKERQLTPTFFMQSTYNAIAGGIAMAMKCNNYNTTYVHRGFAFETALLDAIMQIQDVPERRILLGGFDETEHDQFVISTRTGYYRKEPINSLELLQTPGIGTIQGEGATFFVMSGEKNTHTYARLGGVKMIYMPTGPEQLSAAILQLLQDSNITSSEIDVVVNGAAGDIQNDRINKEVIANIFPATLHTGFKHLCGESCTSSAFGMWLGVKMLYHQTIPAIVKLNQAAHKAIRNILVVNHFNGRNYGLILLHATE